jgi:hypothetical protein
MSMRRLIGRLEEEIALGDNGYNATVDDVAAILSTLAVGKGGKSSPIKKITKDGDFYVTLSQNGNDKEYPYAFTLSYLYKGQIRRSEQYLSRQDVFTKGKSAWALDNTYRLKPETVQKYAGQIVKMLNDPRATMKNKE